MSEKEIALDDFKEQMEKLVEMATNTARLTERAKLVRFLLGHIKVCNYAAVNEEECDVCSWAADTATKVAEDKLDD
jgi:hypothetical protein